MKKLFALILMAALLTLSLAACSTGFIRKTTTATEAPAATDKPLSTSTPEPPVAATAEATDAPAEVETTQSPAN